MTHSPAEHKDSRCGDIHPLMLCILHTAFISISHSLTELWSIEQRGAWKVSPGRHTDADKEVHSRC